MVSQIAYNGIYNGNFDVYVIPTMGGIPIRVTHHGMTDRLIDWYPDGKNLLYVSSMNSGKQRFNQFYKVGMNGGLPEKLQIPYGEMASLSPNGKKIAYTPISQAFRTWKRYRGGWNADIWIFDLEKKYSGKIFRIIRRTMNFRCGPEIKIYYLSDRGKDLRANIWSF